MLTHPHLYRVCGSLELCLANQRARRLLDCPLVGGAPSLAIVVVLKEVLERTAINAERLVDFPVNAS